MAEVYWYIRTGIYSLENPAGELYIGQSRNLEKRCVTHRNQLSKKQFALYSSKKLYGKENHLFMILHELPNDVNQEVLDQYESLFIECYRDAGFTILNTADGGLKGKHKRHTHPPGYLPVRDR